MADQRLERGIAELIRARRIPGLRGFHVEARDGTAIIRGTAHSTFAKWACYECCRRVPGVRRVVDEVHVSMA